MFINLIIDSGHGCGTKKKQQWEPGCLRQAYTLFVQAYSLLYHAASNTFYRFFFLANQTG